MNRRKSGRLLTFQEYDYISSGNVSRAESQAKQGHHNYYPNIDYETFECLKNTIKNSKWDRKTDDHDMLFYLNEYNQHGKQKCNYIQIKNFVGTFKLKTGVTIEILPKIYFASSYSLPEQQKLTRWKLAEMFAESDFQTRRLIEKVPRGTFNLPLTEIGIKLYLNLIEQLVSNENIKSDYVSQSENSNTCSGKPDYPNHIKYNAAHKERIYQVKDEYVVDSPINRLIKTALDKVQRHSLDDENRKMAMRLFGCFNDVQLSNNFVSDYLHKNNIRNNSDYSTAADWSFAILNHRNYDTFFFGTLTDHTNLVPMEQLYEEYIALKLEPLCRKRKWKKYTRQNDSKMLFDDGSLHKKCQPIRPDISFVVNGHPVIMDTKWKFIRQGKESSSLASQFHIDRQDLYQMFVYAMRFHANDIWMLYPRTENQPKDLPLEFNSYNGDWPDINIHIFTVDLMNIDESLNLLLDDVERAIN